MVVSPLSGEAALIRSWFYSNLSNSGVYFQKDAQKECVFFMIQSIQRAAKILSLFKDANMLSLAEISSRMELPKTTVFGLVSTLRAESLLEQDPETKAYFLGIGLFELTSLYRGRLNLRSIAMPYLRELADQTKDTVQLTILDGRDTVYLYKITTPNLMTFAVFEGIRAPGHCTSSGKAILAYMPVNQVATRFHSVELETPTQYSTASFEQLYARLQQTRAHGYAIDIQELHIGLCGVSVPLFDSHGEVCASICISFPYENYDSVIETKVPLLQATAVQISMRLGCPYTQLPKEILSAEPR